MTYNWLGSVIGEETNPTVRDADIVQPTERIEGEWETIWAERRKTPSTIPPTPLIATPPCVCGAKAFWDLKIADGQWQEIDGAKHRPDCPFRNVDRVTLASIRHHRPLCVCPNRPSCAFHGFAGINPGQHGAICASHDHRQA